MEQESLFDEVKHYPEDEADLEFKGSDYDSTYDQKRLTGQLRRIWDLMIDGQWRTCAEIHAALGYPENSIQAQLRNLRKKEFGEHKTPKRNRGPRCLAIYEYCLIPNERWNPEKDNEE